MSTAANESSPFQNPYWDPPISQTVFVVEDLLVINIFPPGTSMKDHILARKGLLDTQEINRFRAENEVEEPRKKRFPFLYPSKPNSDPIST
jgi:hypothetical protein